MNVARFDRSSSLPPRVSIVIVNYGRGWLSRCLPSIAATDYAESRREIIVVDNASGDDLASVESSFRGVRLIRLKENVGYARAVNVGVENSRGEYIAVLNNDVIVAPDWLSRLAGVLERDDSVAAVCPRKKSLLMNRVLDGCGGALNVLGQGWDRGESEVDVGQYSDFDEVTHPSGAVFLTRRRLVDEFGFLLNPDFFMLVDDEDFGLRCWKAGYRVVYTPDCVVYHARSPLLGGLNERNLYFYTKNLLAMVFEVFDSSISMRLFPVLIETQLAQAFYLLYFHGKGHAVPSVLRAVKDFLFNLRLYSTRRVRIARADDREILSRFSPSLVVFEESRHRERMIRLFLSVNNLYVRLVLRAQPITDVIYFKKRPRD
jgi:GT2 family glycosyltransferase